jgi:hypothetical protein
MSADTDGLINEAEAALQPEQPQMIPPQPVPEIWSVQSVEGGDAGPGVAISISTLNGMFVHFLSRDGALQIASQIKKIANTGPQLVTPPEKKLIVP